MIRLSHSFPWVVLGASSLFACGKAESDGEVMDPGEVAGTGGELGAGGTIEGGPPLELENVSGTRLVQLFWTGQGARLMAETIDTRFGSRCSFARADDGELRCILGGWVPAHYRDADCTQPLVQRTADPCEEPPRFVHFRESAPGCGQEIARTVEVGEKIETPDAIYSLVDGNCEERAPSSFVEYAEGRSVEPEELVLGEVVFQPRSTELGVRWVHSEDSGWFFLDNYKIKTGLPCGIHQVNDGPGQRYFCLTHPALGVTDGFLGFADETCERDIAIHNVGCRESEVALLLSEVGDGCYEGAVYELGERIETYYVSGETCAEVSADVLSPDAAHYAVGAPTTNVVELFLEPELSQGRVVNRRYTSGGVPVSSAINLWDEEHGAPCSLEPLASGDAVCVPSPSVYASADSEVFFRQRNCEQEVVRASRLGCDFLTDRHYFILNQEACDVVISAHEAGPAGEEAVLYVAETGTCTEQTELDHGFWIQRGSEVDLDEAFVSFVLSD